MISNGSYRTSTNIGQLGEADTLRPLTANKAGPRRVCFGPASFLRPWRDASRPVTDGNGEQDQDEQDDDRGERLSAGT